MWLRFSVLSLALVTACSGKDEPTSGERACRDLQAKLSECLLLAACDSNQPCAAECAAHAECADLTASVPSGSYLACLAVCSGAGPDDFVCKDAKGFVHQSAVCNGQYECRDGSDEANCGAASSAGTSSGGASAGGSGAGGSGASGAGAGGSGAGGSGAGGSGAGGSGAGGAGAAVGGGSSGASCDALVAHELAACPTLSQNSELEQCAQDTLLYAPEGCGAAWNDYLSCASESPFSCDQGTTGCDSFVTGDLSCQSQFVQRTACTRVRGSDARCSAAAPYAFGCLAAIPSGCSELPATGGAAIACCPTFAPPQN
jgi:hypothetical protein